MKRTVLGVIAAALLLIGGLSLTAQPAGATYSGYITWYTKYQGNPNPTCSKGYQVGTLYGYAYIATVDLGFGYGGCQDHDWYDNEDITGWYAFRTRLDYVGGSVYSDWIYASSPYAGIDTQYTNWSPVPGAAVEACVEVANFIWQYNAWSFQGGNAYCMWP